jgi:phosphatidylglycerophosphate synthase
MTAVEVYRKTRKVPDLFWNAYVCRPVAAVLVDWIKGTRVTPNQITLSALVVAAGSAVALVLAPGHVGLIAAVLLYEASYVLDCADGMLARWRGTASSVGHLLDFLMDEIKAFMIVAAVAVRLFLDRGDVRLLLLGLFGLFALASGVALTTFVRRPELATEPRGAAPARGGVLGFVEGIAKFLIHYPSYIWLAALLDRLELYFYPYIAVNALYFARTLLQVALRFGR